MTRNDITSQLGGKPRKISNDTTVWEGQKGTAPMTPLEKRMWEMICSLTNPK